MLKKLVGLFLIWITAVPAQAAKFRSAESLNGGLEPLRQSLNVICNATLSNSQECRVSAFVIESREPHETWIDSVKLILLAGNPYFYDVSFQETAKRSDELQRAVMEPIQAAGYSVDPSTEDDVIQRIQEQLDRSVRSSVCVFAYEGTIRGEFSINYSATIYVDASNGESLIFSAGYSE